MVFLFQLRRAYCGLPLIRSIRRILHILCLMQRRCAISHEAGVELLGGCIAITSEYMLQVALKRVSKLQLAVDSMFQIQDPQLCLLLLRSCIGMPKLNYCWRVGDPKAIIAAANHADQIILDAMNRIIFGSKDSKHSIDDFTFNLASLPIKLSGLGIDRPSHVLQYAHLAAYIDTFELRQRQFASVEYQLPDDRDRLIREFTTSLHPIVQLCQSVLKLQTSLGVGLHHSQRVLAAIYDTSKRMLLIESMGGQLTSQQQYILAATAKATHTATHPTLTLASQWLLALPNGGFGQTMSYEAFRVALRYRLLMRQIRIARPCGRPNCGQMMDTFCYHALGCKGTGNSVYARHNEINRSIVDIATSAGLKAVYNAREGHTGVFDSATNTMHDFRPGDVTFPDLNPPLCVDGTIGSPFTISASESDIRLPGWFAEMSALAKHKKYDAAMSLHTKELLVFSVDVAGFANREAGEILRLIATSYAHTHATSFGHAYMIVCRRISFAVMKQLAHQLLLATSSPLVTVGD